jgi:pimeloyl-ACP methyl ester carboxylesterase
MTHERTVALILGLLLLAAPVSATCGDNTIDPGEQCDGTNDSGCPGLCNDTLCSCPPVTTVDIASKAKPANSPGSKKVKVTNAKLLAQFGTKKIKLNKARYTRFQLDAAVKKPDAILILIPGFEGGALNFRILAQNLLVRAKADHNLNLEVWAFDRRTNQLEDTAGLDVAEADLDANLAVNWLFGEEIGAPLDPRLPGGRRAVFYNTQDDVPFMANWTNLVFSRDIDAVVRKALKTALHKNVFLGGHSAGTGFTARYAATDFRINKKCKGKPKAGYANLRGLVLLEGGGGSTSGAGNLTDDSLDRMIAKADGGLYGAVRDNAPRCVDGTTPCTIATEATDCAGQTPPKCTLPTTAYAVVPGILNPRIIASSEPIAIQAIADPDSEGVTRTSGAIDDVPDLASLGALPPSTAAGGLGDFLDDDGTVAQLASFLAVSVGAPGPVVNGLLTWQDILHGPLPASVLPNNGPAPTTLPAMHWGQEKEDTRLDRVIWAFFAGKTNFADWYYPVAGPSTTSASGVCTSGTCSAGNVGAACSTDSECSQSVNLDSTQLSAPAPTGRGRCDIENLTQAANINIPVITFSATNGAAPVPGVYTAFAQSIGTCSAPSCDGTTARVIDPVMPNPAFPTFGGVSGGFEVYVNEGYSHLDVLTAEDNADNNVIGPLSDFLARNIQ